MRFTFAIALALLALAPAAHAGEAWRRDEARADAALAEGRHAEALEAYQSAFAASGRTRFLPRMAECLRALGRHA